MDRAGGDPAADRERAALDLLGAHGARLRRTARRVSICDADADDALQRATEILLTKAPAIPLPRLAGWMSVVVYHEALAVRRERERALAPPLETPLGAVELSDAVESPAPGPSEACERAEWLAEAKRLLARLTESQRLAVFLQAQGFSYAEICADLGWTYTKVNRSLAEGRQRLRSG